VVVVVVVTMMTTTTIIIHMYEDRMQLICMEVQGTEAPLPDQAPCYQEK